ncbi:hypothetical protein GOHSU_13_00370 [Gordonia hirsuta DSM 44140 = NBRC 16056]|uniref:ATP synthase protein I n=1 Tax=Gordonia hirsuta DSM 44140 = NBRC 16056 TaxID=1121927 RepID=L7L6N8_9ACTN|nr:hypothetical protein [Gordonia hirsuta]GAC56815.1 hypothetical protein GOHSU_13_00370 [Gordonia hirsuta DSM 44140 = NBRC 16056]
MSSNGELHDQTSGDQSSGGEVGATVYDSLAPLKNGLRYGLLGLLALTAVGLAIWGPYKGLPGVWGVLVGAGVGGSFILLTVITIMATAKLPPSMTMAAVMGSWFLKMVVVLVVMAILGNMDFYAKGALVSMLIGAIVAVLGSEVWGVLTTKTPYIDDVD